MRASSRFALAACALAGCNPSSFNSLLDQAPVVSLSPGGSSTSSLAVLPLPFPSEPGTTSAARMLLSLRDSPHLAVADFDMNGKVTLTAASDSEITNLAGIAVHSLAMRADKRIALGTPKAGGGPTPVGGVSILDFLPTGKGAYTFSIKPTPPALVSNSSRLGTAVAAGNITNIPEGNFIAIGDNTVEVLDGTGTAVAAATSPDCISVQYPTSELYPYRPVAVGDVLPGGFDEIVLGLPGKVVIVQWDSTNNALTCPLQYVLTMNGAPKFGSSVAIADFDGNGHPDLAVGSPPDGVYVFYGPLADTLFVPGTAPVPSMTIRSQSSTSFGERVAAYAPGGQLPAQLLVADPGAAVDGRHGAGKVMLFALAGQPSQQTDANAIATLFDATAGTDPGLFGLNLGGVEFNPQLCPAGAALPIQLVPWASNAQNLLAFFNYNYSYVGVVQDPRCFALKP